MLVGLIGGLVLVVVSFLTALYNMSRIVDGEPSFKLHLACMAGTFIGGLAAIVCGIGFLIEKFGH